MIIRQAFYGGEWYYCDVCWKTTEENFYPTDMCSSSAKALWDSDREAAIKKGIHFEKPKKCDCKH